MNTDTSIITIIGFDTIGTLLGGTTIDTNFSSIDSSFFAVMTTQPVTGTGSLIKIGLQVHDSSVWGEIDTVRFLSFLFNEGNPAADVNEGLYIGQIRLMGDVVENDTVQAIDASQILKYVIKYLSEIFSTKSN